MDPAVLDTDVASLLHKGTLAGPLAARLIGREPLITFVTFGELAKWAEIRNWGQRNHSPKRYLPLMLGALGAPHSTRMSRRGTPASPFATDEVLTLLAMLHTVTGQAE